MLYDSSVPRPDPSAPSAPAFYKDKVACDQRWYKSTLGEEVSAWLQVTFTAKYDILNNSGLLANVDVSKPLAPQMQAAIERMQAAIERMQAEDKLTTDKAAEWLARKTVCRRR